MIIVGILAKILWSMLICVVIPWYRVRTLKKYACPATLDKYERLMSMQFNRDMRATIQELNALRKRLAELTENPDTPQIEGMIDIDFMIDFVAGFSKEAMREDYVVDMFDDAKPYWELLEWGDATIVERNIHKEYAEKGALLVDAHKDSPETATGKHMKRMMEIAEQVKEGEEKKK